MDTTHSGEHAHHHHEHEHHDHKKEENQHSGGHGDHAHGGHGVDHSGHEIMFRNRFFVNLILTIPVLLFSPMIQEWFNFSMPEFAGSELIGPAFAFVIFAYGGVPFLQMAVPEIKNRQPGMMTLISLAIVVAFAYSVFALLSGTGKSFFWEMATLIDVMLLGHWIEMRSIRQASGALNELAKLMPDTAERIDEQGNVSEVSVSALAHGDVVLVRPGASVPADGEIMEGHATPLLVEAIQNGFDNPLNHYVMSGFGNVLIEQDILDIIDYMRGWWTEDQREYQAEVTRHYREVNGE